MRILDRHLLQQVAGPFVLALLALIILMVSGVLFELSELLIAKKIPFFVIIRLFFYRFPQATVEALPLAALVAGLLAYTRIAADNELAIIRSVGVSLRRHLAPLLALVLVISLFSLYLSEKVVPQANHAFENIIRQIVLKNPGVEIEQNVFFRAGKEYFFYIGQVNPETLEMKEILVYQLRPESYPRLITAESGVIKDGVWLLSNGVARNIESDGFVSDEIKYTTMRLELGDGLERFFANQKTTREMTRAELAENIRLFRPSGVNIRPFVVDYHLKLASPLASLILVLFCLPLAIRFLRLPRYPRSVVVGLCVALTLTYYVTTPFCRSLGVNGLISPVLGAWLPNLAYGSVGLLALAKVDSL